MAKHKLFLLDAFALLYRSHFAFIKNPRISSKGLDTSAVFGFMNTLLEIINKEDPSHLAVVFDTKAPTFRHIRYEPYKAQREAMPESLAKGIPYAKKLLEVLNISMLAKDGFEADDIVGTLSAEAPEAEYDVYMVTPDKDYAQLVKENVFLYKPRFRGGGFDVMGREQIIESFNLPPEKIIDFLGLKGDAVDNIPGIPKVGDKTAVALINEFGTVEEIVKNAENITKKSIKATVLEHGEQGLLSKELATIKIDVPHEWKFEELALKHMNMEATMELMQELEFKTSAQRILNTKLNPMRLEQQKDLFGNVAGDSEAYAVDSGFKKLEDVKHDYQLVDTAEKRQVLIARIEKGKSFCWDTETTGLDALQVEIVGLAISLKVGEAFYIPFSEDQAETKVILHEFKGVLESDSIEKIGQNLKYDILVLKKYDIHVAGPMFDTMLAHYVDEPHAKHGMDAMAESMLNYETISIETLIGKKGKKQKSMRDLPAEEIVDYASEDADITLQLKEILAPKVKDNFVFEKIEQPLMPVLADMETEGVRIDEKALVDYSEDLSQRLVTLKDEIYKLAGEEFNINSPRQLGEILFEKQQLGKGLKAKKTKTGQYVTNEQVLSDLAVKHELPAQVLAYRGIKKLQSTYVDALPKLINPNTGRVHTTFSQSVAVTGRLASINPNLQNIPIRTKDGREVRKGFIPRDKDHVLLAADYSQVELRIMAALSKDENMLEAFNSGMDIHRASAARVFGVDPDMVSPEMRSSAKTVNFGIIYGISAFGLSQRMGISRTEAKDIIETYFAQYSRVKAFMDESVESARKVGYTETYFGRRRYLPDINSRNATVRGFAERNAINSPIQGTAADIIKLAMIEIHHAIKAADLKSKMILQVHDELVFDAHASELEQLKAIVHEKMMGVVDLGVALEVEMGTGQNWLEAH